MRFLALALVAAACSLGAGCGKKASAPPMRARDFVELSEAKSRLEDPATPDYRRYCAFCHGNEGKGDGLNAFNLTPPPRNFTDPKQMKSRTAADVAKAIRKGGEISGISPDMPAWGKTLSDEQIEGLTSLVLSFPSKQGP